MKSRVWGEGREAATAVKCRCERRLDRRWRVELGEVILGWLGRGEKAVVGCNRGREGREAWRLRPCSAPFGGSMGYAGVDTSHASK